MSDDELTDSQQRKLDKWLVPGSKLRIFYREGSPGNMALEIRALVDDQIVYRVWSHRKGWIYHIDIRYGFELWMMDGRLSKR